MDLIYFSRSIYPGLALVSRINLAAIDKKAVLTRIEEVTNHDRLQNQGKYRHVQ